MTFDAALWFVAGAMFGIAASYAPAHAPAVSAPVHASCDVRVVVPVASASSSEDGEEFPQRSREEVLATKGAAK